jgi:hypothetical protein
MRDRAVLHAWCGRHTFTIMAHVCASCASVHDVIRFVNKSECMPSIMASGHTLHGDCKRLTSTIECDSVTLWYKTTTLLLMHNCRAATNVSLGDESSPLNLAALMSHNSLPY